MDITTLTAENITIAIIGAVAGSLTTSFITEIIRNIKKGDKKPYPNIKDKYILLFKYFIILSTIVIGIVFLALNKFFVVSVVFLFSVLALMIAYDYTTHFIFTFNKKINHKQKEELYKIISNPKSTKEETNKAVSELKIIVMKENKRYS